MLSYKNPGIDLIVSHLVEFLATAVRVCIIVLSSWLTSSLCGSCMVH